MKTDTLTYIKTLLSDRLITVLLILFILMSLAYCIYVSASLRPSDLQVAVHYTAFGDASFYRDKWYYFINFIVFGAFMAIAHVILVAKLYIQGRRQIALLFAYLSFLLLIIGWILTWAILKVAFL